MTIPLNLTYHSFILLVKFVLLFANMCFGTKQHFNTIRVEIFELIDLDYAHASDIVTKFPKKLYANNYSFFCYINYEHHSSV